jgi:ribosomal protein S18 acetylase RimI-like enzyme
MTYEIRRLTAFDAIDYHAVRLHGLRHDPVAFNGCYDDEVGLSLAEMAARIPRHDGPSAVFGAYRGNELVGIVSLSISPVAKLAHKGVLWGMYTLPSVRGTGVGRALMSHLLDYARKQTAVEQIHLSVTASNIAAKSWYEELGFRLYGVEPRAVKFASGYEDDELRVLDLYRPAPPITRRQRFRRWFEAALRRGWYDLWTSIFSPGRANRIRLTKG